MSHGTNGSKGSTDLAQTLITRYEHYSEERLPIQAKWEESRENFLGILNKKWKTDEASEDWQSDTHVNITKQKVMAAYSLVLDHSMQGGKIPFSLMNSPWDSLMYGHMPQELIELEQSSMRDMQTLIEQQMLETHADRTFMKNLLSLAIYGETYAKQTVDAITRRGWKPKQIAGITDTARLDPERILMEPYEEKYDTLWWVYRPNWNIFRDLEYDDINHGAGLFDRDFVSPYWLRERIGQTNWLEKPIEDAIAQAQSDTSTSTEYNYINEEDMKSLPPGLRGIKHRKNTIRYLEYYGRVTKAQADNFEEYLKKLEQNNSEDYELPSLVYDDVPNDGKEVEIIAAVAGEHVVMYTRNDPDERIHLRAVWDMNLDEQSGSGVADNVKHSQKTLNGAVRAFEDNKKLSGNVILATHDRFIEKMPRTLSPGANIQVSDEVDDVRRAIQPVIIPDVGASLLDLIGLTEKHSDEDSMIPKVQQGQTTRGDETAFEVSQRIASSGKYINAVLRNIDEQLVEPMVNAYYERNMEDPNIKIGQGNYTVKALGVQSFQNRVIGVTNLTQWLAIMSQDPSLLAQYNVSKILDDIARGKDIDPEKYKKTDQQIQEGQAAMQEAQQAEMQMSIAERQAKIDKDKADAESKRIKAQADIEKIKLDKAKLVMDARKEKANELDSPEELRKRYQPR